MQGAGWISPCTYICVLCLPYFFFFKRLNSFLICCNTHTRRCVVIAVSHTAETWGSTVQQSSHKLLLRNSRQVLMLPVNNVSWNMSNLSAASIAGSISSMLGIDPPLGHFSRNVELNGLFCNIRKASSSWSSTGGIRDPALVAFHRKTKQNKQKWVSGAAWLEFAFGFTIKKNRSEKHCIATFAQ